MTKTYFRVDHFRPWGWAKDDNERWRHGAGSPMAEPDALYHFEQCKKIGGDSKFRLVKVIEEIMADT